MPLLSNALTTADRLSSFAGIDTPTGASLTAMEAIINAVSSFIERYTQRTFKQTTYTQEEYSSERGQTINLQHFPVVSSEPFLVERRSSQLNENSWDTIDGQFYSVDYNAGLIHNMDGVYFFRTRNGYRVTYTAGYDFDNVTTFLGDTEAADIEVALWLIAQDVLSNKSNDSTVKSERIGDYAVTYGEVSRTMFGNPAALEILDSWKDLQGEGILTPLQSI